MLLEQRIAEYFLQIGGESVLRVIAERGELDVEDLSRFDEQIGRKLALIMLYEVEIARRDAEA